MINFLFGMNVSLVTLLPRGPQRRWKLLSHTRGGLEFSIFAVVVRCHSHVPAGLIQYHASTRHAIPIGARSTINFCVSSAYSVLTPLSHMTPSCCSSSQMFSNVPAPACARRVASPHSRRSSTSTWKIPIFASPRALLLRSLFFSPTCWAGAQRTSLWSILPKAKSRGIAPDSSFIPNRSRAQCIGKYSYAPIEYSSSHSHS